MRRAAVQDAICRQPVVLVVLASLASGSSGHAPWAATYAPYHQRLLFLGLFCFLTAKIVAAHHLGRRLCRGFLCEVLLLGHPHSVRGQVLERTLRGESSGPLDPTAWAKMATGSLSLSLSLSTRCGALSLSLSFFLSFSRTPEKHTPTAQLLRTRDVEIEVVLHLLYRVAFKSDPLVFAGVGKHCPRELPVMELRWFSRLQMLQT